MRKVGNAGVYPIEWKKFLSVKIDVQTKAIFLLSVLIRWGTLYFPD